jgi:hypothetical protein
MSNRGHNRSNSSGEALIRRGSEDDRYLDTGIYIVGSAIFDGTETP